MTLLEFLRLVKKNLKIIIIIPVAFGIITAAYCWTQMDNVYSSSVRMYILASNTTTSNTSNGTSPTSTELSISEKLAEDISIVAESSTVKEATASNLGMPSLSGYSVKTASEGSRMISLRVSGTDQAGVVVVANELSKVTAQEAKKLMDLEGVNIVDPAKVASLSGPNRTMYTGIAIVVGLCIGLGIVVLKDILDTTVKSKEEAEDLFGLPVLGQMADLGKDK